MLSFLFVYQFYLNQLISLIWLFPFRYCPKPSILQKFYVKFSYSQLQQIRSQKKNTIIKCPKITHPDSPCLLKYCKQLWDFSADNSCLTLNSADTTKRTLCIFESVLCRLLQQPMRTQDIKFLTNHRSRKWKTHNCICACAEAVWFVVANYATSVQNIYFCILWNDYWSRNSLKKILVYQASCNNF